MKKDSQKPIQSDPELVDISEIWYLHVIILYDTGFATCSLKHCFKKNKIHPQEKP